MLSETTAVWCVHQGFLRTLKDWFLNLRWFECSVDGAWVDTSWVELFWGYLATTGRLPPFWYEGKWVMLDDDPAFFFVLPSVVTLFRTWRRAIGSLCKDLTQVPWAVVSRVSSAASLGARFGCPGVTGRFDLPSCVLSDLADQFAASRSFRSLRLPDFL